MLITLKPHPKTPGPDIEIAVEVMRPRAEGIDLRFLITGDVSQIVVPERVRPSRADELWRSTCFEAFIQKDGGGYCELNQSPAGYWAAYEFSGYREGMYAHPGVEVRDFRRNMEEGALTIGATFDLDRVMSGQSSPWRIALSAVIETKVGDISYWALGHPSDKPDFHHPASFVLELP
jgi:hypothetical protein